MKTYRFLLFIFSFIFSYQLLAQKEDCVCNTIEGYRYDKDDFTNLRDKPNGKIIGKLEPDEDGIEPIFSICKEKNGWLYIEIDGGKKGWIFNKIAGASLRNYDGQPVNLYKETSRDKGIKAIVKKEEPPVLILHCQGRWAYIYIVETKQEGWIEGEWLCANSVTSCP